MCSYLKNLFSIFVKKNNPATSMFAKNIFKASLNGSIATFAISFCCAASLVAQSDMSVANSFQSEPEEDFFPSQDFPETSFFDDESNTQNFHQQDFYQIDTEYIDSYKRPDFDKNNSQPAVTPEKPLETVTVNPSTDSKAALSPEIVKKNSDLSSDFGVREELAQAENEPVPVAPQADNDQPVNSQEDLGAEPEKVGPINFTNVSIIEYIRFISRVSNQNFVFEEEDLQFTVTIVSEAPTTISNLMAALMQELRVRDLSLIEDGSSIIIHRNPRIRSPGSVVTDANKLNNSAQIVTRVFRLNTLDPSKILEVIRPMLSDDALVEVLRDSNNLIVTDLSPNVAKLANLIESLDAPNSGVIVGQYAVRNGLVDSVVDLAYKIILPIAQGNPFVLVPHASSNSIFIVSNPFIVNKAISILQNIDQNDGTTKILNLDGGNNPTNGYKLYDPATNRYYDPYFDQNSKRTYPLVYDESSKQYLPSAYDSSLNSFVPLKKDTNGRYISPAFTGDSGLSEMQLYNSANGKLSALNYDPVTGSYSLRLSPEPTQLPTAPSVINETNGFLPGSISAASRLAKDLPSGHIAKTIFYIYKLKYRRGDQIETSIRKIALSLSATGLSNADLVAAINSVQWIESSNSLIFTGTAEAIERIKDLVNEIDTPLNQVYIEMLILDTTLEDSLTYGVDWGVLFGGGNTSGGETFQPELNNSVFNSLQPNLNSVPNAKPLLSGQGFNLGIIGRHLTHNGMHFSTISALVRALHRCDKAQILLNPRILTEDNVTAEIFVGETDRYKTQSISNDQGNVITNNFEFIDVGTTLRVTPLISNNGIITLDIIEEVTSPAPQANTSSDLVTRTDVNLVPVLLKNRSTTRIHIPDGFFVVMSGLIDSRDSTFRNEIPCLGMIPVLGGAGKFQRKNDRKRNLMIFIRPVIINTECEINDITKRQQDVYRDKSRSRRAWNYEIDEALDFFNIKSNDPDEVGCRLK